MGAFCIFNRSSRRDAGSVRSPVLMCWLWWLWWPCWLCWLAFGCCGAPAGVGCGAWGCGWAAPCGGMTPVAAKNWLTEEHRSATWAASSDQLLSSACRMLSFRPGRRTETDRNVLQFWCRTLPAISFWSHRQSYITLVKVKNQIKQKSTFHSCSLAPHVHYRR